MSNSRVARPLKKAYIWVILTGFFLPFLDDFGPLVSLCLTIRALHGRGDVPGPSVRARGWTWDFSLSLISANNIERCRPGFPGCPL